MVGEEPVQRIKRLDFAETGDVDVELGVYLTFQFPP